MEPIKVRRELSNETLKRRGRVLVDFEFRRLRRKQLDKEPLSDQERNFIARIFQGLVDDQIAENVSPLRTYTTQQIKEMRRNLLSRTILKIEPPAPPKLIPKNGNGSGNGHHP